MGFTFLLWNLIFIVKTMMWWNCEKKEKKPTKELGEGGIVGEIHKLLKWMWMSSFRNTLVLHTIMRWRKWHRKRQNMWLYQRNIKRTEFGIFNHLYRDLLEDGEKYHGFFRINIEQLYSLSQLVAEEIWKQNTEYTGAKSPEERLPGFEVRPIKIGRR